MMRQLLAVAAGGAAGAVLRWLAASSIQKMAGGAFHGVHLQSMRWAACCWVSCLSG